jgi:hypothetical protein
MKKVIFSLALLLTSSLLGFAQKGISYQAIILDPKPIEIPGQDITGQPFVNGQVSLKFKLFSSTFVQEFEEVHATQTDAYGMVNVLIGSQNAAAFSALVWDINPRNMQVWVSFDQGGNYTKVSEQVLTYTPYALYAETTGTAGKLSGTLTISEGGTGAKTAENARTNLGLGNVDNTSDANKPISTATQNALDTKANATNMAAVLATKANAAEVTSALATKANAAEVNTALASKANASEVTTSLGLKENLSNKANTPLGTSTTLYPTQNAVKTYVDAQIAAATIADANGSTKGKIQLAGDLAGTAAAPTVPGLALKADAAAVASALNLKANTAEVTTALGAKANASEVTTALAQKVDQSKVGVANGVASLNASGIIPLSQLPAVTFSSTTVVGSAAAMTALSSATVGSIAVRTDTSKNYVLSALPASNLGNWVELLTPAAPVQAVNGYTGTVNLSKADFGLSNVNNTSDLNKPISTATQNALDLKANASDVVAALNLKANATDVASSLALKANVSDMNTPLASKATVAVLAAAVFPKANATEVDQALNLKLDANKLGVPNGTASLNALGKIPTDQIPAISFSSVKVLGSQAEMLALSSAVVGSVVIRTDVNKNFVLAVADPTVLANWIELLTPAPPVQTVNGYTGTVSLSKSDLGLSSVDNTSDAAKPISTATQSALTLKADASSLAAVATSGSYTDLVNVPTTVSAASLSGIVPIANGGTGASTAAGAIANLGAENTSNKSTNLQTDAESTSKYPSVKLIKDYVDQSISSRAALGSPAFTGTPTAPTAATGTATTQLATTAFVKSAVEAPRNNFYIGVNENLGLGSFTALPSQTGVRNTLIGNFTLQSKNTGDNTTALGHAAGNYFGSGTGLVTSVNKGLYLGAFARSNANNQTNEIVIGADALGNGSNTIQLGNTAITNTKTSGTLTAGAVTYPNTHGTANQVLTTTGSGTLTWSSVSGAANASNLSGTVGVANGGTGATTAAAARTNLGLVIGTDVQAPLTAGTDYLAPTGSAAGLTNFPTFNQNTTGNAATATLATNATTATNVSGIVAGANGGTGVANSGKTITLGGNFQTTGGNALTLTTTATTNVTLPTSGTLATVQQVDAKAPLASPALTGTPTAPTAATADNSTKIATTEFVQAAVSAGNTGIRTIGAIPSTSNAKGAVVSGTELVLTPADASNGGVITTGSQTFAGAKTFANDLVTNGTLSAGTVTYPSTHGSANQVLSTTGSGTLTWTTPSSVTPASLFGTQAANTFLAGPQTNLVTLASYDGSSLAGWTTSGAGITSDSGTGNPSSSFKTTGANQYMYRSLVGDNFRNKTIQFDVKLTSGKTGINIGTDSNGGNNGLGLTLYAGTSTRNGFTGSLGYLYTDDGGDTYTFTPGTWYTIKIITNNGAPGGISWYVNGALVGTSGGYGIGVDPYFGIASDNGTAHFDNLTISGVSNASDAVPTFRALVPADFPTLNQNTTGNAATATSATNATTATNVSGIVAGANGGTGVANSGKSITLGGNFQTTGGHALTLTTTATTNVTLPSSGTLATVQQVDAKAPLASPALTGTPTAPTAPTADNSTKSATTEFVQAAVSAGNTGIRTVGAIPSTSNAKGAVVSGTELVLTPADASNGGIITTGSQTFAGAKTFANDLVTNGTLTAGTVTYPKSHGTANQVLSTTGSGTLTWTTPSLASLTGYTNGSSPFNVGLGINTSASANGQFNTAVGVYAMQSNISSENTAIGYEAMRYISQPNSNNNVVIGSQAAKYFGASGQWNPNNKAMNKSVYIGSLSRASNYDTNNEIVIGYDAVGNGSNTVRLGNTSITAVHTQGSFYANSVQLTSDYRLKKNIKPLENGISTVLKLNPVNYEKKNSLESSNYDKKENGFIAQEIQKVLPYIVDEGKDKDRLLSVDYTSIIPVLTKAIQEQQVIIEQLKKSNDINAQQTKKLLELVEKLVEKNK